MAHIHAAVNNGSHSPQAIHLTHGTRLHEYVAQRSGFLRTGYHLNAKRIGGKLVEASIERTTANHVQHFNRVVGHRFQPFHQLAIAQRHRLEDASANGAVAFGHRLPGATAVVGNGIEHAVGVGKNSVVGVDERAKRLACHGGSNQLAVTARSITPLAAATLVNPHSTTVFQQADGAVDAALVGDIKLVGIIVNHRMFSF